MSYTVSKNGGGRRSAPLAVSSSICVTSNGGRNWSLDLSVIIPICLSLLSNEPLFLPWRNNNCTNALQLWVPYYAHANPKVTLLNWACVNWTPTPCPSLSPWITTKEHSLAPAAEPNPSLRNLGSEDQRMARLRDEWQGWDRNQGFWMRDAAITELYIADLSQPRLETCLKCPVHTIYRKWAEVYLLQLSI
jgi:hypothetical protein